MDGLLTRYQGVTDRIFNENVTYIGITICQFLLLSLVFVPAFETADKKSVDKKKQNRQNDKT